MRGNKIIFFNNTTPHWSNIVPEVTLSLLWLKMYYPWSGNLTVEEKGLESRDLGSLLITHLTLRKSFNLSVSSSATQGKKSMLPRLL